MCGASLKQYVGNPTHKPVTPSYFTVYNMQSAIPLYEEWAFYNLVLALSNGNDINEATIPATKEAVNLIPLLSFLSVNLNFYLFIKILV